GSRHGCHLGHLAAVATYLPRLLTPVVVFNAAFALLFVGKSHTEVEVEIAAKGRRPGKCPSHAPFVRLQLRERRSRHCTQRHVVIRQVHDGSVEAIRNRRAGRTARRVVRSEHEVVNEQLRSALEKIRKRRAAFVSVESIRLVDPHPRQFLTSLHQFVAAPGDVLFRVEQLQPRCEPLFTCSCLVCCHDWSLLYLPPLDRGGYVPHSLSAEAHPSLAGERRLKIDLAPEIQRVGVTSVAGFGWTR